MEKMKIMWNDLMSLSEVVLKYFSENFVIFTIVFVVLIFLILKPLKNTEAGIEFKWSFVSFLNSQIPIFLGIFVGLLVCLFFLTYN